MSTGTTSPLGRTKQKMLLGVSRRVLRTSGWLFTTQRTAVFYKSTFLFSLRALTYLRA